MKARSRRTLVSTFVLCAFAVQVFLMGIFDVNTTKATDERQPETEETASASYVSHQVNLVGNSELDYTTPRSIYKGKAVSIEKLDVFDTTADEAQVIGELPENAIAQVVEHDGEWVKITSGNLTGFVKSEALCFDEEAEAIAVNLVKAVATVSCEEAKVFESVETDAKEITAVSKDTKVDLLNMVAGYYNVALSDGTTGYISKDQLIVNYGLQLGKTNAELKAIEEAKQQQAAKAAEEARKAEEARQAAAKAQAEANAEYQRLIASHTISGTATTQNAPMTVSEEEVMILACIVDWESNWESYEGKLAVANVVLNRVRSANYANTIKEVVLAPYQFSGATDNAGHWSARFQQLLNNGTRNPENIRAAREALAGVNNIGSYCSFRQWRNYDVRAYGNNFSIIGAHVFH